jgi:hypothetical protein
MKMNMKKSINYILFSLLGMVVVLWQLLLSGYVLTLDMVFGPVVDLTFHTGNLLNALPLWHMLSVLSNLIGGEFTEKLLLVTLFFSLFYIPLHFFKKIVAVDNTYGAEYVVTVFFAINPFVYERFLAGHWMVLLGYVLILPIFSYLIDFCNVATERRGLKLIASILLLGIISTHILIMVALIVIATLCANWIRLRGSRDFLIKSLLLGVGIVVGSSYWLIPAYMSKGTAIASFGPEQWEVFKTVGSGSFDVIGKVLSLQGFWEEGQHWATHFWMPSATVLFSIPSILIATLVIVGVYAGVKDKVLRTKTFWLVGLIFLALVFSSGVGDSFFRNYNLWMFEHVSFWKGFRDSQKWSAIIAVGYALCIGLGSRFVLSVLTKVWTRRLVLLSLACVPIMWTPMMLFGFAGQLQPVQYPASWEKVNTILKDDTSCKAIFLPWHQYYSLVFNNNLLTANLARNYFACDVMVSRDMELTSAEGKAKEDGEYLDIEKVITDNSQDVGVVAQSLYSKGIHYVIYTDDIAYEDPYKYHFLESEQFFTEIFHKDGIWLYKIVE